VWVAVVEAILKKYERKDGPEETETSGLNAAGLGIELVAMKQAHGKLLQKI
jgi:hypothetical protein